MTHSPIRTELRIAPFTQPDGQTLARLTLNFRGALPEAEAVAKAKAIIAAKPLNNDDRGYLLNCIGLRNYEMEVIL